MTLRQQTQPIQVPPQPVEPTKKRRQRRHRLLKAIILLTVPFYCIGTSMLALAHIETMLSRASSSPLFLGGLAFFALLLIIEPFTGVMTHTCTVGAKTAAVGAADPLSCLTVAGGCLSVVGVLGGFVALVVWLL